MLKFQVERTLHTMHYASSALLQRQRMPMPMQLIQKYPKQFQRIFNQWWSYDGRSIHTILIWKYAYLRYGQDCWRWDPNLLTDTHPNSSAILVAISIFHRFIRINTIAVYASLLASNFIECQIYDTESSFCWNEKAVCNDSDVNSRLQQSSAVPHCSLAALSASQVLHAMCWACKHLGSLFPIHIGRCTHS